MKNDDQGDEKQTEKFGELAGAALLTFSIMAGLSLFMYVLFSNLR